MEATEILIGTATRIILRREMEILTPKKMMSAGQRRDATAKNLSNLAAS